MTDARKENSSSRSEAHWRAEGRDFILYVNGRVRAQANTVMNAGEIHGPWPFRDRKVERMVPPLGQPILDTIEAKLGLSSPAPIIDHEGRPAPEMRREIDEINRRVREKLYLETDSRLAVIGLLNGAHDDLNKAAVEGRLTPGAAAARLKCAEALQVLEDKDAAGIPPRAAQAVREAAQAIHRDDLSPGASILSQSYHVRAARYRCDTALEHVEHYERTNGADSPSRSVEAGREREASKTDYTPPRRTRSRGQDVERER